MRYIADLHIHSCYSRATSKGSRLPGLAVWAAIKGIRVVGTGDFTHPAWLQHLMDNLEPAEPGFFRLAHWQAEEVAGLVPDGLDLARLPVEEVRFVLSAEISSIYKKGGRVRKVHNLLYAPDFDAVQRINRVLAGIGNIESDGRPILGLDSKRLLEIFLEHVPRGFFVPAHIWTPWFSLFGSRSGFDELEECFDDLSREIFALETGLSSDPDMNRCISALDRYTLISNSDCHSPAKLGREANIFTTGFDFFSMKEAIRTPVDTAGNQLFAGTVEFYPEEGKYHNDGHRKCGLCLDPRETRTEKGLCPVCGKPVTIGVLHRVVELADRDRPEYPKGAPGVHSLIPLLEMLGELLSVGPSSKKVMRTYAQVINTFGSEFNLLLDVPVSDISTASSRLLGQAVERVRKGRVIRRPGFDGEFGVIRVFEEDELARLSGQLSLFGESPKKRKKPPRKTPVGRKYVRKKKDRVANTADKSLLNDAQEAVVRSTAPCILVQAGPGTGKTHTLVARLVHRLRTKGGPATVITFTNKAAGEVRERLARQVPGNSIHVNTLHGFCLHFLRQQNPELQVVGPSFRRLFLRRLNPDLTTGEITSLERNIPSLSARRDTDPENRLPRYFDLLKSRNQIDLDRIIPSALAMLRENGPFALKMRQETGELSIDEFQDLNPVQYELIMELSKSSPIFAIGDPDQAIYGFRGADPRWFYRFIHDARPECYFLRANYRSDINIIQAATRLLAGTRQPEARQVPVSTNKGVLQIYRNQSARGEAAWLVRQVEELIGGSSHREVELLTVDPGREISLSDIGILYRTTRQAELLSDTLFRQGIPFQVVDIEPFFLKKPLKELSCRLQLAAGSADPADLLYLLGLEKGIGKKTLERVEEFLLEEEGDPLDILGKIKTCGRRLQEVIEDFQRLAEQMRRAAASNGVAEAVQLAANRYAIDTELPEMQRFFRLAGAVGDSLDGFVSYLQANSGSPVYDDRAEALTLMTIHAAKGIEFPVVFLIGANDNLLPLTPRQNLTDEEYQRHVEEERRLFYVAMTRAEHLFIISWYEQGTEGGKPNLPSRFIQRIPRELFEQVIVRKKKRQKHRQLKLF